MTLSSVQMRLRFVEVAARTLETLASCFGCFFSLFIYLTWLQQEDGSRGSGIDGRAVGVG